MQEGLIQEVLCAFKLYALMPPVQDSADAVVDLPAQLTILDGLKVRSRLSRYFCKMVADQKELCEMNCGRCVDLLR